MTKISILVYAALLRVRMFLMRHKKGVLFGRHAVVDFGARIYVGRGGHVVLGEHCYLKANPKRHHNGLPFKACICCREGANVILGDKTRSAAYISAYKKIQIGRGCLLAGGVNIMDSNGIRLLSPTRADWQRDEPEEIIIGDNVWVCINSTILKGTVIGNNCVVAANSVVKGKFPDNVIIGGVPAKIIKQRFN